MSSLYVFGSTNIHVVSYQPLRQVTWVFPEKNIHVTKHESNVINQVSTQNESKEPR